VSSIDAEAIRRAVEARAEEIIGWVQALIRFPSENRYPDGNEGPAQEFVAEECRKQGWEVDVFSPEEIPGIQEHPSWLAGRNYGNDRCDVVARWPGRGDGKSALFSGHIDVAPFEPDDWQVCRPYEPIIRDGRLYGRGSVDMKGGLSAGFWALRVLQDLAFEPAGDLLFESLVDEEFASGNGTLAARLRGHNADLAVVLEPTKMEICTACLGAFLGDMIITGSPGMPYMGTVPPNPIRGAARAVLLFDEWLEQWRAQNDHPMFAQAGKELNVVLWRINSTRPGEFTQMGTPLITNIGWIVWGHPGMTEEEFYRRFRAFWDEHASSDPILQSLELAIEPDFHYVRPWETSVDSPAVQAVVGAFGQYTGQTPSVGGAPYSCDLAIYGDAGDMPAVLLGPEGDNVHAPDEWVKIDDILDLTGILAALAVSWSGSQ